MIGKLGKFIVETLQIIIFAISIFLFVYLLILQPHKIKGASMEPNFHDSEYLLTDKLTYRWVREPERGEVIVFKAPPTYKDEFIKRIIGLPGERIRVESGKVYINGKELNQSFLPGQQLTRSGKFLSEGKEIVIPTDKYIVMGDNRDHSLDSREFGFVEKDKITGKAWVIYWPPSEAGQISTQ